MTLFSQNTKKKKTDDSLVALVLVSNSFFFVVQIFVLYTEVEAPPGELVRYLFHENIFITKPTTKQTKTTKHA